MLRHQLSICVIAISLCAGCDRPAESKAQNAPRTTRAPVEFASSQQGHEAFYWAANVEHGGPWLIYIDSASTSGILFEPLTSLALCDFKVAPDHRVSFRSAGMASGTLYRFAGLFSPGGFEGSVKEEQIRTAAVEDSFSLKLRSIAPRFLSGATDSVSGDYLHFQASDTETGDLHGSEIVLIHAKDEIVGIRIDYDGGVNEVWSITGNRVGDTLKLSLKSENQETVSSPVVRGDTLVLRDGRVKFVKRHTIPQVFSSNLSRCK
jgi:hypothetical protein